MSIPGGGSPLLLGGAVGYKIERSLRFNSSDSAYLSRTPASAGNRKTFTISLWVKRCKLRVLQSFISSANDTIFLFDSSDKLCLYLGASYVRVSTQVFRDVSAWYHLVLVVDTPNATAQNRVRMYVNNSEITVWDTNGTVTQNSDTTWNAALAHQIGANNTSQFPDQYIADFHNIDGQALDPTSFAETNATTGQWVPKAYSGSYGTNGFQLKFADNSAATATTLGKDTSGNGNNWTPNNLSVTAGAGNDSLVDTPTSYGTDTGAGGEVRGNYATLNPLLANATLANGYLDISGGNADFWRHSTIGCSSGKWYAEMTAGSSSSLGLGIYSQSALNSSVNASQSRGYFINGQKYSNGSLSSYGNSFTTNDVIGIAFDVDAGKVWFSKNGTWQASGDPVAGTNAAFTDIANNTWFVTIQGATFSASVNFGQRQWAYAAPAGFKALCDTNLPAPVVAKSASAFDVKLYTGNGSTQTISGLGFSPDLVWIKARSVGYWHRLIDSVRGAQKFLYSNDTSAERTSTANDIFTSFDSTGFTLGGADPSADGLNQNTQPYAAWCWDAGSSTVTNTQGSITTTVRANASAGFSIVTYTGTGTANSTFGHGLGVAPSLIITKNRGSANDWYVYHASLGVGSYLELNTTNAAGTLSNYWSPVNSTVFGQTYTSAGPNNGSQVAYCFAPVAGYSSFGSYTGNGSADGPFVFTGMRPRWIMLKRTDSTGNWTIIDTAREGYNVDNDPLYSNLLDAEGTADLADILSNGFKLRSTDTSVNASTGTYVYACFAEAPFALARAR